MGGNNVLDALIFWGGGFGKIDTVLKAYFPLTPIIV
jgi:hypothetical protein